MEESPYPFVGTEALAAGYVTRRALRSQFRPVYRNVFVPNDYELTATSRAVAASLWSGRTATVAGLSAAALYGTRWIDPTHPAELYRRNGKPVDGTVSIATSCGMTKSARRAGYPPLRQLGPPSISAAAKA